MPRLPPLTAARTLLRRAGDAFRRARGELDSPGRRLLGWVEVLAMDHGIFRLGFYNLRRIGPVAWRSGQPRPGQLRALARRGLKTVVNLRGPRDCATYLMERAACAELGLRLIDFTLTSRAPPSAETVRAAARLFQEIDYPVLFHCKSGADRAGMMAALYLLLARGRPVAEAKGQLALRYGHVAQAKTGVLDHFFRSYEAAHAASGISFEHWLDRDYDPDRLKREFRTSLLGRLLGDRLLRRE